MKKLILSAAAILLCASLLTCCKKEEKPDPNIRDYTSFVFWHNTINTTFPNCVVGYFDSQGLCHKVAELGDLEPNVRSKEVIITNPQITEVYFFSNYYGVRMMDKAFKLRINYKNIFEAGPDLRGIPVDENDPYKYPH